MINDVYRRYMLPGASEAHYLWAARVATIF
jgi:Na+/proline symporter